MTARISRTPDGIYGLIIQAAALLEIDKMCTDADSLEIGGVLVGYYTEDGSTAVITEALPPPKDSARGPSWFHRGVADLRGILANRWVRKSRTYYVGEWHYHPAVQIEPSVDDLAQMQGISQNVNYQCLEPIMLIAGQTNGSTRTVRAFVFPRGATYLEFLKLPAMRGHP